MDGFSFCGIHCSEFGIGYIPSPAKRMLSTPGFKPIEESVPYRPGGYWYGNQVETRTFALECYFEEIDIETQERMLQWLHRDKEGPLVFDDRPYVTYTARPSKIVEGKSYATTGQDLGKPHETLYSGTLTITFCAHDPFGKMSYIAYDQYDQDGASRRCGIMEKSEMPSPIAPQAGTYLVYNPGTEVADTVITVKGSAPKGMTIRNLSSGDVCEFVSVPSDFEQIASSEEGSVRTSDNPDGTAFEYHDFGFVRFLPCTPYWRDVSVNYQAGSNVIRFDMFAPTKENIGQHIRLAGEWLRIISVGDRQAIVNKNMSVTGFEQTMIATMNEIEVSGDELALETLTMEYTPRVR